MAGALFSNWDGLVWLLLFLATVTDLRSGKIPNLLTFSFLGVGIFLKFFFEGGFSSLGEGLLSVLLAFALFFPLYFAGIMAAGDVKLLMAAGIWLNTSQVLKLAGATVVIGAIVGFLVMLQQRGIKSSIQNLSHHLQAHKKKNSTRMPLAPAFFCAFCFLKISEIQGWKF